MHLICSCQVRLPGGFSAFVPALETAGAPLWKILEAGEWRSPAFLSYLDMNRLETDLVVQAHLEESDAEHE